MYARNNNWNQPTCAIIKLNLVFTAYWSTLWPNMHASCTMHVMLMDVYHIKMQMIIYRWQSHYLTVRFENSERINEPHAFLHIRRVSLKYGTSLSSFFSDFLCLFLKSLAPSFSCCASALVSDTMRWRDSASLFFSASLESGTNRWGRKTTPDPVVILLQGTVLKRTSKGHVKGKIKGDEAQWNKKDNNYMPLAYKEDRETLLYDTGSD